MSDDDALSGVHAVTMADIPFEAIREHWRSLSTWPPHMAVAWVAEPTWEEIVAQARRQTGAPRMREASEAVLAALSTGKLIAYGMRVGKRMDWIPPERITIEEWGDLIWIGGTLSTAAINKYTGAEVFRDVQIDKIGLLALFPSHINTVDILSDKLRGESKGPLMGQKLREFALASAPPPAMSMDDLFKWLQEKAKEVGRRVDRDSVRKLHGTEDYPSKAPRGRPRKSPK